MGHSHTDGASPEVRLLPSIQYSGANFEASFAPASRPSTISPIPWYRSRNYLLHGWTDPSIWRSVASIPPLSTPLHNRIQLTILFRPLSSSPPQC